MKIFYLILSQKQIIFRVIIKCNNIFETNILYRGYPTKLNNNRNSRGWGVWQAPPGMEILSGWGSSAKVPSVGRGGGMDIFWNYTIWGSINCSIWTQSCWKGNKETILAFNLRSGECCNLTCKTFTLAYTLAHSNRICGNLTSTM